MPKVTISTPDAAPPGGAYSQAVAAGDLLFLAGQGPFHPDGQRLAGTFDEQMRLTLANLEAVARAGGGSLADAVRVGVYLRDMSDFAAMDAIFREVMPEPRPARTTIQTALPGFDVEIDAVLFLER
jgi:2-iminobutanoate/2-iminopropanoate deaminase